MSQDSTASFNKWKHLTGVICEDLCRARQPHIHKDILDAWKLDREEMSIQAATYNYWHRMYLLQPLIALPFLSPSLKLSRRHSPYHSRQQKDSH